MSRKVNNVTAWLEASAAKFADKTVFADDKDSITYSQFVIKAKSLALKLCEIVRPGSPIAVLGNKSVDTLVAFFACVYAGCFYVPLNPSHPEARLVSIIDKLDKPYVLVTSGSENFIPHSVAQDKILRTECSPCEDFSALSRIASSCIDTDPLYVIFTSGSTGVPKGIAVSHRSVIDFIEEFTDIFKMNENDVFANQAPFDFDVSVKDIYSTVKCGATLHIVPKSLFSVPTALMDYLKERKITTMVWAASALCLLSGFRALSYKAPDTINKILFSGEVMPVKQLNYWKKFYPEATFVNLYGPTEITCNCTYYVIAPGEYNGENIPIGKPFPNERVLLLDDDGKVIDKPNTQGEICVCGTALSLGYYNNPDETARAFIPNPSVTAYEQKIYRTGDIGYFDDYGIFHFIGRRDFQIKYMGHRIELSEIEKAMSGIDGVTRTVCIFDEKKQKIRAFYMGTSSEAEIGEYLRGILPVYMVPGQFVKLDAFPLTENGKTDRRALSEIKQ